MSWETLVRDEAPLIALVGAIGGQTVDEVLLKVAFLKRAFAAGKPGDRVEWNRVVDILEDAQLEFSDQAAREVLLRSGMCMEDDGALRLTDTIRFETALGERLPRGFAHISRDDLLRLAQPAGREADGPPIGECDACLTSMNRTSLWGARIAASLPEELPGVPCFWQQDAAGEYAPFNLDPASVTTSDALRLVVERARVDAPLAPLTPDLVTASAALWEKLLLLQRSDRGWNDGAFAVPAWDDDFVGAYQDDHAELGPCPTIDAAGGAVVALCAALHSELPTLVGGSRELALRQRTRRAVANGADFLLRTQSPLGGWPVYRYEADRFEMPVREVSSWYAVEALSDAVRSGHLSAPARAAAGDAAGRYLALLDRTAHRDGTMLSWVPELFTPFARAAARLQATATVGLAVSAIARAWPALRPLAGRLQNGALQFVASTWDPDPSEIAIIEFRVATWDGPADTRFTWEWPLDPLVVSMVIAADLAGAPEHGTLSERMAKAVRGFLAMEADGHWQDFLMKKEGDDRAIVGNTIFYHRALLDYAGHLRTVLERFLGNRSAPRSLDVQPSVHDGGG